jgi:hypothetical protein
MQSSENGKHAQDSDSMAVNHMDDHGRDSVTKENSKFDDLKRCESEFIDNMKKKEDQKQAAVNQADIREAKMQELIAKAEKYASFLLSRHRAHVDARKAESNGHDTRGRRRMSDVDVDDDKIMLR